MVCDIYMYSMKPLELEYCNRILLKSHCLYNVRFIYTYWVTQKPGVTYVVYICNRILDQYLVEEIHVKNLRAIARTLQICSLEEDHQN
jgi:hypothetical protein